MIITEITENFPQKKTPTIALNMIVKNEGAIITRLLQSVLPLIDAYCICDTGSTDNTKDIIREFFKTNTKSNNETIYGVIIEEPFRDFGYNRTFALHACQEFLPNIDYVLLLDADMILSIPQTQTQIECFKHGLCEDIYHLFQGSPTYYYKNVRMVKNVSGFSYWGVTHEYVNSPPGSTTRTIERDVLFINDIGDGGAKDDKKERDIRLLQNGLKEHPNNDRYTFYLANTYREAGQHEEAIETYKKRIDIGGWIEEIWQSYYCIGKSYMELGDENKAIISWLAGYDAYPMRIENLYKIIRYFRERGKNKLAFEFFRMADESRKKYENWSEYLFLERDVYDYLIDYEMTIFGYYVDVKAHGYDLVDTSMKVLNYLYAPEYIFNNVLSNYKFYADKVKVKDNLNSFSCNIRKQFEGFVSSTPSIISTAAANANASASVNAENYLVNVRYVNYRIDENGNYVNQENIITHNMIAILDKATKEVQQEFLLEYDTSHDGRYIGLEDVRLYADPMDSTRIRYTANRGIGEGGKMHVETGRIEFEFETDHVTQTNKIKTVRTANSVILESPENRDIEKNWVLFPTGCLETKCVYTWWPLVIGDLSNQSFVETHRYASAPSCLKHVRGSTNGVLIDDEIWFLCHTVSYENRRYYYHLWVILDSGNYGVKRLSPFFTFEGEKVEYALGLMYEKDTDELIVGYSVLDKTTQFLVLDKKSLVF